MSRMGQSAARRRGAGAIGGFTLIEVMVALAIVAITLLAGNEAGRALVLHGERQSDLLLAQLCAENQLVALRLSGSLPAVGDTEVPCVQAGRTFSVHTTVMPTPNPNFLRVDAHTYEGDRPLLRISTILGRL